MPSSCVSAAPALELDVAERLAVAPAARRQRVVVARRRSLTVLRQSSAERPPTTMARWYGGHAAVPSDLIFSSRKLSSDGVEERLGLLEEEGLVRRAAALRHVQEVVLVAARREQVDLRGQVRLGVDLRVHVDGRHLRVAQVALRVRVEHAARDVRLVLAVGHHAQPALAEADRRARVLAARQHHARRDVRVLEQLERDEPVVLARVGVVEDLAQLREVPRPQQVRDVRHRGRAEQRSASGSTLRYACRRRSIVET